MKRLFGMLAGIVLFIVGDLQAQVARFTFEQGTEPAQFDGLLQVSPLQISSGNLFTGSVNVPDFSGNYVVGNGWTATSREDARNFFIDITAREGFLLDVTGVSVLVHATAAGPEKAGLQIGSLELQAESLPAGQTVSLNSGTITSLTGVSEIRIAVHGWLDGSRASSGNGQFRMDDLIVEGVVRPIDTTPTVPLLANPVSINRGIDTAVIAGQVLYNGGQPLSEAALLVGDVPDEELVPGNEQIRVVPFTEGATIDTLTVDMLQGGLRYGARLMARNASGTALSDVIRFSTKRGFDGQTYSWSLSDGSTGFLAGPEWTFSDTDPAGEFGSGTNGGLRSGSGLLGYQLTGTQDVFTAELELVNTTGSTLSELMIGYHGRVERTVVERSPAWEVEVNGTVIPDLAYSTESGNDVFGIQYHVQNLSIENGQEFRIRWTTGVVPGSGLHRHIGLSDVVVAVPSTVELAMHGDAGWRMYSSPLWYGSTGFIQDISPVQGFPGQGFPPNVYTGYDGSAWIPLGMDETGITEKVLQPGKGYLVYVFDNNLNESVPVGAGRTLSMTGIRPFSDVQVPVHSDGNRWNLLGNPFPEDFDIREMLFDAGGVPVAQIWQDSPGGDSPGGVSAGSWVLSNSPEINHRIPAGQGFMWQNDATNPSGTLTFPRSGTLGEISQRFRQPIHQPDPLVQFTLHTETAGGVRQGDKALQLVFSEDETADMEGWMIDKLPSVSGSPQAMFLHEHRDTVRYLAQKVISVRSTVQDIPLHVTGVDSTVTHMAMSWQLPADLTGYAEMFLKNDVTGETVDLHQVDRAELGTADNWYLRVHSKLSTTSAFSADVPRETRLAAAYPNPFNPVTTIRFDLATHTPVKLEIFDMLGRPVDVLAQGAMPPGVHQIQWDARNYSSGTYLVRLRTENQIFTRKMTLIK